MIPHCHPGPGLQNGCHCNWRSGSCGGYGHYRRAWRGITAYSVAFIVCEVEVSAAGDGGPIAGRDLGLNQVGVEGEKKKSIRRWTKRRELQLP